MAGIIRTAAPSPLRGLRGARVSRHPERLTREIVACSLELRCHAEKVAARPTVLAHGSKVNSQTTVTPQPPS